MKPATLIVCLTVAAAVMLPGCFKADVRLPENIGVGSPAPGAAIAPADPSSKADLLRENQQLRARIAWLDEQSRESAKDFAELENEQREIQADMAKIAAERDRYLRRRR
jgi:hypothetical protein